MHFDLGEGPKGPRIPRPNFCGGAICYRDDGARWRLKCGRAALPGEALCLACRERERDEVAKDLERVSASNPKNERRLRTGSYG